MIKLYVVLLLVVVALLALPSTRRSIGQLFGRVDRDGRRDLVEQAREQAARASQGARTAATAARGTAEAVVGAGESVAQGLTERRLRTLGRTLSIEGDPVTVGPVLTSAVARIDVVDVVAPGPDEALAWMHSGSGDTRFAARPGPAAVPTTEFGVVSFEYFLREPQGMSVTDDVVDAVTHALTEAGVRWTESVRTFTPGPQDSTDGERRLA